MSVHVMVDLETLGTAPGSVIWSIGAAKFDPMTDMLDDTFHVVVDVRDAVGRGLTINADTMLWWMDASRTEAREQLLQPATAVDTFSALHGFAEWYGQDSLPTWGNGATFDNVLLRTAMERVGVECPWRFWDDRCYRTFKALAPAVKLERLGTHHNALSDAISQARHMQNIIKSLGLTNV